MKLLKILNTLAIAIPAIISLFALLDNEILFIALASTMLTGLLQLIIGCSFWLKHPKNIHIKIYFAVVAIFFVLFYILYTTYEYIFALPVVLCIYLSYIIYTTPNEVK